MKRLVILLLAAGLLCTGPSSAHAVDVKISGEWDFNFEWSDTTFNKHNNDDIFKPRQRLRTQIDIIASENLRGVVQFEIGDTNWGSSAEGAALGTDGHVVEVRYSYVDWAVPDTALRLRMGLQPFALPGLVAGSAVLDGDAAGLQLTYPFSEQVAATLFWMRAENDNWQSRGNALDLMGLSVPITGDNWQVNPWGMFGMLGKNSLWTDDGGERVPADEDLVVGMLPLGGEAFVSRHNSSTAWWLGLTGEITVFDALHLAGDVVYGKADWGRSTDGFDLTRQGWMAAGLAEYKLDMVTPGLLFWYASGDDGNALNGSERLPTVLPSWQSSSFGFDAAYGIADGAALGLTPTGTWGVAFRLADLSFVKKLSHTLLVGYYRGTNSKNMPRNAGLADASMHYTEAGGETVGATYLTTKDAAWEVNFDTQYTVYDDLTLALELGYIRLNLDEGVWGDVVDHTRKDAWKVGINLHYAF